MPKTMKLTDVGSVEATVLKYINDPNWIMQQKFDGTRVMVTFDPKTLEFHWSNDGVKGLTHAAARLKVPALQELLLEPLQRIHGKIGYTQGRNDPMAKISLDGELLIRTGEFVIWDYLVEGREEDIWFHRQIDLMYFLRTVAKVHPDQDLVKKSPTAETTEEKLAMWKGINEANVEGAVSKHRESLYVPGIRTKEWVKHKLVKTADLVVIDYNRVFKPNSLVVKEGSARLGYAVNKGAGSTLKIESLVSASLIGKDLSIQTGDVVEVAYLYREPGGGLVQPRILRKRWDAYSGTGDKWPSECTEDQFPEYSRQVVSLEKEVQQ